MAERDRTTLKSSQQAFDRELIRYGSILEDNSWKGEKRNIRTRIFLLNGQKFFHYMVNGKTMDIVYMGEEKTHRFYYSRQQKELKKLNAFLEIPNAVCDGKKNYITLEDGREAEYTQRCSTPDSRCNFPDAVLAAELCGTELEICSRIVRKD